MIKYVCKELWTAHFKKQVDRLQTDHRVSWRRGCRLCPALWAHPCAPLHLLQGVYVLQDRSFRWLTRLSAPAGKDVKEEAAKFTIIPCGIIRGALANMGVACTVVAEIIAVPSVKFSIRVRSSVPV
jgi:hypothetical protein